MQLWRVRKISLAAILAGALACAGDAVSPTDQSDVLVSALEGLSRDCNQQGDADGSLAFTYAAMAVRLGVEPSEVTLQVGDQAERFLAFVHVVRHGANQTAVSLRTLVAFKPKAFNDRRPTQVLYVGIPIDSARLEHPASASAMAAASAVWKDLTSGQTWVATLGKAGIKQETVGGACPKARSSMNLDCVTGTFSAFVDGDFYQAIGGRESQLSAEPVLGIRTRAASIAGATIVFTD